MRRRTGGKVPTGDSTHPMRPPAGGSRPDTFPVLRIRANGPTGPDFTEITLGDADLLGMACVVSLNLDVQSQDITRATIVVECRPDIDLPVEALFHRYERKPRVEITHTYPSPLLERRDWPDQPGRTA